MANLVNYGVIRNFLSPKRKFKWPENLNKAFIELKEVIKVQKEAVYKLLISGKLKYRSKA